jgi:hypothetical protein
MQLGLVDLDKLGDSAELTGFVYLQQNKKKSRAKGKKCHILFFCSFLHFFLAVVFDKMMI